MPSPTPDVSTLPRVPKRIRTVKAVSSLARIAELAGITVKQAWIVRETVARCLREAALRREPVRVLKFGAFTYRYRKPRNYYDIQYGGIGKAPGYWVIWFKPSAALNAMLNPQDFEDADKQPGSEEDGH